MNMCKSLNSKVNKEYNGNYGHKNYRKTQCRCYFLFIYEDKKFTVLAAFLLIFFKKIMEKYYHEGTLNKTGSN